MIRLNQISKTYPHATVLQDVTWELKLGDRIGIVGPNGAGKTSQLRIITGEIEPTTGEIIRNSDARIAYLTQEFELDQEATVRDELASAFTECHNLKKELAVVHTQMETATGDHLNKLIHKMDRLQREYELSGGYQIEMKVDKLLPEIGFSRTDGDRLVKEFSGGWQMRMGVGKVILREPNVLLLDEPTNHLDLQTVEWLEGYLKGLSAGMAIISHDREFLDRVCTKILECERGVVTLYNGNYSAYIEARELTRAAQQAAFERQQKEIERQEAFVDRFRASATRSTQAKSREKQLEKIELIEEPEDELRTLKFKFPPCAKSGREVLRIKDLMHGYAENVLFLGANLLVERGDRIAFLGPNGSGKSTLLRLIMGQEKPLDGSATFGEHNIIPAYFEQNQSEALDLDKNLLDTIWDAVPQWKTEEVRGLLGRFLFPGDTVFRKVGALSGGEKARLALAKLLLGSANLLVLDEPTNHLDIPAKETVEEALKTFEGSVIIVSHDRYLISAVANKIVEINNGELKLYHGNYQYYKERKEVEQQEALLEQQATERATKLAAKRDKDKQKKLNKGK